MSWHFMCCHSMHCQIWVVTLWVVKRWVVCLLLTLSDIWWMSLLVHSFLLVSCWIITHKKSITFIFSPLSNDTVTYVADVAYVTNVTNIVILCFAPTLVNYTWEWFMMPFGYHAHKKIRHIGAIHHGLKWLQTKNVFTWRTWWFNISKLQNFKTAKVQKFKTSKLQKFKTSKLQNFKTSKLQNAF